MKFRILVFAVIVVLLVSSYVTIIPSLELCSEKALMKSLLLVGHEGSFSLVTLRMGDTFAVVAEVDDVSNAYFLTVQDGAGEVFSKSGGIDGSSVEVDVPLYPPSFEAGKSYVVYFRVYAFNYPLPGVVMSDRGTVGFAADASETRLSFEVGYDGVFRCLGLWANLTNVDGCPLVDESVSFSMRPVNGKRRLTDGWIPIGSARTNGSGIAFSSVAFGVPDGNYSFKAYHKGDENFGESENVTEIEISSNATGGFGFGCEFSFGKAFSFGDVGDLTISVSSDEPYALLRMNATAQYVVDEPLPGPYIGMFFFCDRLGDPENGTGFIGGSCDPLMTGGAPYSYTTPLEWIPEVVGHHELIVGVVNGSLFDIISGMRGVGLRVLEEVDLEVQRCPSNLVVHYQHAVYDAAFPFSVGFSMPRAYSAISTDFYAVETLAPKFTYNGADYVVDSGIESAEAKLFLNDTLKADLPTDENGLAILPVPLTFSGCITANVTVVVSHGFCQEQKITRVVTFTNVSVDDSPAEVNDLFEFNYTMGTLDQGESVYAGVEMPVDIKVSLLDLPVWHVPVSVLAARFGARCCTYGSGWMWMPDLPGPVLDYVRVTSVFSDLEAPAAADVNGDGQVNLYDAVIVLGAYGSKFGDESWNPIADVVCDGVVDLYDIVEVLAAYGETVTYEEIDDFSIVNVTFDNGQQVCLDSQGCVEFPLDASGFNLSVGGQPVGAVVELFSVDFDETCLTNNVGGAEVTWQPAETGRFLFQVKLPSDFHLVAGDMCDTEINTSVNLVNYYVVEKRPIDLSVNYVPDDPTLDDEVTMIANVFDLGLGEPAEGLKVEFYVYDMQGSWIYMGCSYANSSGVATFAWTPRDYLEETGGLAYFVLSVRVVKTACTEMAEEVPVNVDTRYLTRLEFLMGGDVIDVAVGEELHLYVKLVRADDGSPVDGVYVNLYIDGVKTSWAQTGATGIPGVAEWWPWVVEEEGVYEYTARFEDWNVLYQTSNEARLVVVAEVVPLNILFDVQPREFKPGTSLTLTAQVNDSRSGEPLSGYTVRFYAVDGEGSKARIGENATNGDGVATLTWTYALGPWAFVAEVATGQSVMSSPVMLTVAKETVLKLDVEKEESSFEHTFSGMLLSYGEPVLFRQVRICVNDTVEAVLATNPDGSFSVTLNLQPADDKPTTYNVQTVFDGDEPHSATAYGYTPNGTEYAVCTTIQYGFKPASNAAWLTVEPQATEVATPTKTPEELQQEAKESGYLRVEPRFSWWYPWFRLHLKLNVNLPQGNPDIDYGWSLLPFGESYSADNTVLANILNDVSDDIQTGILVDVMAGVIIQFGTASILGRTGIYTAIAILTYVAYQTAMMLHLYFTSGGNPKAWLAAFITSAFSGTCGAVIAGINSVSGVLTSTSRLVLGKIESVMNSLWAKGLNFFSITGVAFALIDFAFMILYLTMYLASI